MDLDHPQRIRTAVSQMILAGLAVAWLASGCSGESEQARIEREDHAWQQQVDTLEQAKQIEGMLNQAEDDRRQQIDDLTR